MELEKLSQRVDELMNKRSFLSQSMRKVLKPFIYTFIITVNKRKREYLDATE